MLLLRGCGVLSSFLFFFFRCGFVSGVVRLLVDFALLVGEVEDCAARWEMGRLALSGGGTVAVCAGVGKGVVGSLVKGCVKGFL